MEINIFEKQHSKLILRKREWIEVHERGKEGFKKKKTRGRNYLKIKRKVYSQCAFLCIMLYFNKVKIITNTNKQEKD